MSYILDALQRAQSQREQGTVPGLHTPTLAPATPRAPSRTAWVLGALALVAVLAVLGSGWWPGTSPAGGPPASVSAPVALAPTPAVPAPTPPIATTPAAPSRTATPVPAPPPAPAPVSPPAAKPATASQSQAQPPLLAELPDDLRRQLPALNVTGAVQAQDPRHSLLLVNGQVLSPGAELAPGLVLESVDAHSAVLRWNGKRFRVGY